MELHDLMFSSGAFSGGDFTSKFRLLSSPKCSLFSPLLCWMVICEESWLWGISEGQHLLEWGSCVSLLLWSTPMTTAGDRTVLQLRLLAWAIKNLPGLHASLLVISKMFRKCWLRTGRLPVLCLCCLPDMVRCWEVCLADKTVCSGSQRDCFQC